ncbi:hypothetical protein BDAP_000633 [Binucleata daphniae]
MNASDKTFESTIEKHDESLGNMLQTEERNSLLQDHSNYAPNYQQYLGYDTNASDMSYTSPYDTISNNDSSCINNEEYINYERSFGSGSKFYQYRYQVQNSGHQIKWNKI